MLRTLPNRAKSKRKYQSSILEQINPQKKQLFPEIN